MHFSPLISGPCTAQKIGRDLLASRVILADAECVKHPYAKNRFKYLGLATLIALVAIRHVAERISRV